MTELPGTFALRELPPGSVRPLGWLRAQLELQARGLTGRLDEVWPSVGPESGWLGGAGESWERGPYYLDGLVPLAHGLGDPGLLSKARTWIEAILASQGEDGWFGPDNDDWWPRIVALKALIQHADATGDERIAPFLEKYFRYQSRHLPGRPFSRWARIRGGDEIVAVAWLYERTGEAWLLDFARLVLSQTTDWDRYFRIFPYRGVSKNLRHLTHVVNVAMGVKTPAAHFLFDGDTVHREAVESGLTHLDRFHGQVHGMFSGDEHLAGTDATRGVELCAVVEMMYSLQTLIRTWGSVAHADRLEQIAYNLLPAAMTADVTAHQYHQQATQVLVSVARRDWTAAENDSQTFGLEPNFGCCTANLHQGWPKLLRSMWLETPDGGIAAVIHGPSSLTWDGPHGRVEIDATTTYPFGDTIRYEIRSGGGSFPLSLRIPAWSGRPETSVGGEPVASTEEGGFLRIDRDWATGDVIEIRLPSTPRLIERPSGAVGVALGSIVLVYSPGEIWERFGGIEEFGDWEVRPRRSWGIGLATDSVAIGSARVDRREPGPLPFGLDPVGPREPPDVPLCAWVEARRLPDWPLVRNSAAPPSPDLLPRELGEAGTWPVPLVPYGSARLRLAEFPLVPSEAAPGIRMQDGDPDTDDGFERWDAQTPPPDPEL